MTDPTLVLGLAMRATLVLAFAWLLTTSMRRASAAARHLVWTCAIAAAALVPVAALFMPDWQVRSAVLSSVAPPSLIEARESTAFAPLEESPAIGARPNSTTTRTVFASLDYAGIGVMVWTAGTVGLLLYVVAGLLSAWRLRRRSAQAGAASVDETHELAAALGIPQPLTVVQCEAVTTPMVCGIWRPVILLPSSATSWPEARRHVVLLHELAHVKRRDCLTQLLAQIVCAAYWFNPLVWIAARRLRTERERACDDFVLAAGAQSSEYATHLLEIARAMQPARLSPVAATAVAMARRSQVEGRLMAILDPAIRRSSAFYTRIVVASAVALVSVPVAAIRLVAPTPVGVETPAPAVANSPGITLKNAPAAVAENPSAQAATPQPPPRATVDDRLLQTLNKSLIEFAGDGDLDGVTAMLTAGADVNAQVDGDGSPLIAAAGDGHLDVVRLLLDKGADPNLIVPGDGAALIAAAADGHIAVVDLLLQRGAQVNLVAEGDETALIQASGDGHLDVVKLLVSRGADVNLGVWADRWVGDGRTSAFRYREPELRTPLSEARGDGHLDVVRFLISAGARD